MKTTRRWIAVSCGVMICAAAAHAAAPGGAGPRDSLLRSDHLHRLGVGADYEWFRRGVDLDNGPEIVLEARRASGLLMWDVLPWFTLFGSAGNAESRLPGGEYGSQRRHASVGIHARLWHTDISDPLFMAGRLSLDTTAEFARTRFDLGAAAGHWTEQYGTLTLAYELFVDTIENLDRIPYSLRLYVGPALSRLDGTYRAGGASRDFEETKSTGITWGAELFLSHNLSFGYGAQRFDRTTSLATMRYRF